MEKHLQDALQELKKLTGISFSVNNLSEAEEEEAEENLLRLVSAWKSTYDKESFLRRLLAGQTDAESLYSEAARFGLRDGARSLYLVTAPDGIGKEAERVLKNLFLTKSGDLFVRMNGECIVLVLAAHEADAAEVCETHARTIADMLGTESMLYARVAYSAVVSKLGELPRVYKEAAAALRISEIFYTNIQVCTYDALGIGKLIYDLPEESCRRFLRETLGDVNPAEFDEETAALINAFFANNLSIAEAARQLYMHRNTMSYRLDKLKSQTGLDLRTFDDAVTLKLAMMIANRLREGAGEM